MTLPENTSFLNGPGEGEAHWVVGTKATIKGPGVLEFENPAGWEVPLHVHEDEDEVHYYLEGRVTVRIGDKTFTGTPGSLCFLPRGIPHALTFEADAGPGRWLWISPDDRSGFAREAGSPATRPEPAPEDLDMEQIMKVFERYGMRFIEGDA
jgi:quercetin dioxygenase-like cupin family protein